MMIQLIVLSYWTISGLLKIGSCIFYTRHHKYKFSNGSHWKCWFCRRLKVCSVVVLRSLFILMNRHYRLHIFRYTINDSIMHYKNISMTRDHYWTTTLKITIIGTELRYYRECTDAESRSPRQNWDTFGIVSRQNCSYDAPCCIALVSTCVYFECVIIEYDVVLYSPIDSF